MLASCVNFKGTEIMRRVVVAMLLCLPLAALAGTPLPDAPHIVVTGEGKVSVKPDSARIRFNFMQRSNAPLPAKQGVDAAVNRLLGGLSGFRVADGDVSASELSANEDVDFDDKGRRVANGFIARRDVTVVLKDVGRLNEFLDAGLAAGATAIAEVGFESTHAARLREEAKQKAVADAREKATGMARAFDARLGGIYSINSVNARIGDHYGATTLDSIQVSGSRVPGPGRYIQPSVDYTASVSAVFELQR